MSAVDDSKILSNQNTEEARKLFYEAVDMGIDFKLQENVRVGKFDDLKPEDFIDPIPEEGKSTEAVVAEFKERFMPYSYNFASPQFMGFPDAGNSVAGITGSIIADFMQQNLINQSFCSPVGTFAEISVIRWLREVVGYTNPDDVRDVFDAGGVITGGGTTSNTIGILLARENHVKNTMTNGVSADSQYYLVVPKGIGHYSVKSAQMWLGCGNKLIEVETKDFRYDLDDLRDKLTTHKGQIMGLVAYAGDSRTMTVENLQAVAELTRSIDPGIWLHADACHGFSLGFSDTLRDKIKGIELFDSITTDPHKVMNSPYTLSALLVKDPAVMRTVSSLSDLIMKEQYAFGQITPFIGSKPWMSLKLWFAMKSIGRQGFGKIIDERHAMAELLATKLRSTEDFTVINEVDINAVGFMYHGNQAASLSVDELNELNKAIHHKILEEGKYHLHQFSLPDAGIFEKGAMIYPLRFMCGNPLTEEKHLDAMIEYVRRIGESLSKKTA